MSLAGAALVAGAFGSWGVASGQSEPSEPQQCEMDEAMAEMHDRMVSADPEMGRMHDQMMPGGDMATASCGHATGS